MGIYDMFLFTNYNLYSQKFHVKFSSIGDLFRKVFRGFNYRKVMAKLPERPGLVMFVLKHFFNSLKPKFLFPPQGKLIGQDPFGNKYFEIPADPRFDLSLLHTKYSHIHLNLAQGCHH